MTERLRRLWVYGLLVLLAVPGAIGFDLWPITGWRLFSLSRDATQTEWALDVVSEGAAMEIDLERLPLAFRNAAWPLAELPGASEARREAVCRALLEGVLTVEPDAVGLTIVRERRTLRRGDEVTISEEREPLHTCEARP